MSGKEEKKKGPQTKVPDPPAEPPKKARGHRGPKGGAAIVSRTGGEVTVHGLQMKEWQKTPMTLLQDYCKSNKRLNPRYDQLSGGGKEGFRFRLVLQDPKRPGTDKDLIFMPSKGFSDDLDAKHTVALLALHSLEGNRPYEQKLPEPYRTLWLQLSGSGSGSSAAGAPKKGEEKDDKKAAAAAKGKKPEPAVVAAAATASTASSAAPAQAAVATAAASSIAAPALASSVAAPAAVASAVTPLSSSSVAAATTTSAAAAGVVAGAPAPSAASSAAAVAPAVGPPPKRLAANVIDLDVRLTSSSGQAADKKRRQNERDNKRRERENKRKARLEALKARHAESVVYMSSGNRDMVEAVLKQAQVSLTADGNASTASLASEPTLLITDDDVEAAVAELVTSLGFTPDQAEEGVEEAALALSSGTASLSGASGGGVTVSDIVSAALDWLCLHTPEHLLPKAFDPRGKNELRLGNSSSSITLAPAAAPAGLPTSGSGGASSKASTSGVGSKGGAAAVTSDAIDLSRAELSILPLSSTANSAAAVTSPTLTSALRASNGCVATVDAGAALGAALAALSYQEALPPAVASASDGELLLLSSLVLQSAVIGKVTPIVVTSFSAASSSSMPLLLTSSSPTPDPVTASSQEGEALAAIYGSTECDVSWTACSGEGLVAALGRQAAASAVAALGRLTASGVADDDSSSNSTWEDAVDAESATVSLPASSPFILAWRTTSVRLGHVEVTAHGSAGSSSSSSSNGAAGKTKGTSTGGGTISAGPLTLRVTSLSLVSRKALDKLASSSSSPVPMEEAAAADAELTSLIESGAELPAALTSVLYPNSLPAIALTCPAAPQRALLAIQARLLEYLLCGTGALFHSSSSSSKSGAPEAEALLYPLCSWLQSHAGEASGNLKGLIPSAKAGAAAGAVDSATSSLSQLSLSTPQPAPSPSSSKQQQQSGHALSSLYRPPRISPALAATMDRDDAAWAAAAAAKLKDGGWQAMQATRSRLPVAAFKPAILDLVSSHQVLLLSGETGCGKTTQVPQFILEQAIAEGRGGHTRIIVTQPRRIAAIGVAQRVAAERCEPLGSVGGAVGYQIRGEKRAHAGTPLLFTTTGVLLRRLASGGLGHVTHIVVDEVHERGVDTDFLLAVLKRLLPHRRDIKLICMSATMDAARFATYFGGVNTTSWPLPPSAPRGLPAGTPLPLPPSSPCSAPSASAAVTWAAGQCPIIAVPGFTHPVREVYLEDIVAIAGYQPRVKRKLQQAAAAQPAAGSAAAALAAEEGEEEGDEDGTPSATDVTPSPSASGGGDVIGPHDWKRHGLDYGLCAALIRAVVAGKGAAPPPPAANGPKVSPSSTGGAVLVFLPGVPEIRKLHREIERAGPGTAGMWVLHLHGALTADEQGKVFSRPPPGLTKVVLATNVAETSITIDDVTTVIDTLRVKESSYDHAARMARLVEGWVSQAGAKQRRGRAGRVRPGVCYRLEPAAMHGLLAPHSVPEIQRVPLESLILQVKVLGPGLTSAGGAGATVRDFMRSTLDPPSDSALATSVRTLVEIGALTQPVTSGAGAGVTSDFELTPLGYHLASLPMDVRLGKALLFGALLRCVDPLLTITASLSDRPPWRPLPPSMDPDEKAAIEAARAKLSWPTSDHLSLVKAYDKWRSITGQSARRAFCDSLGLSYEGMRSISDLRHEYAGQLAELGFLPGRSGGKQKQQQQDRRYADEEGEYDEAGDDVSVAGGGGAHSVSGASSVTAGSGGNSNNRRGGGDGKPGAPSSSSAAPAASDWGRFGELSPFANACATDANVIRAALVAGLYPNLVKVVTPPRRYHETAGGNLPTPFSAKEVRYFTLADDGQDDKQALALLMGKALQPPAASSSAVGSGKAGGKKKPAAPIGGKGGPKPSPTASSSSSAAAATGGDTSDDSDDDSGDDGPGSEAEGEAQEVPVAGGRSVLEWKGFTQDRVFLHPSSVNFSCGEYRCPWLVYHEKVETGKVFIRDSTMVSAYALLLLGGPLAVHHREGVITVGTNGWVRFHAEARIGVLVKGLRAALSKLLAHKIAAPGWDVAGHPVIGAITRLLQGNGV